MGQYTQAIQKLYVAYFSRPADPAGVNYWDSVATQSNGNFATIQNAFSTSTEYRSAYANKSSAEVVDQVYINLFGRHAEAGGLKFWSDALANKLVTVDYVVESIAHGAQGSDLHAYNLKVAAATLFTNSLDVTEEILGYAGNNAAELGKAFLSCVVDDASYNQAIAPHGKLDMTIDIIAGRMPVWPPVPVVPATPASVAVGEPSPNASIAIGEPMAQLTGWHEMAHTTLFM